MNYSAFMLSSFLVRGGQQRVLLVGLGGGSLFHLVQRCQKVPEIEVVEIDPVIVDISRKYFFIEENEKQHIINSDGFTYIHNSDNEIYDAIYLDAYLKPGTSSDSAGYPLNQKTLDYLKTVRSKLVKDGVVVINLNSLPTLHRDLKLFRKVFAEVFVFEEPVYGNIIIVATKTATGLTIKDIKSRGRILDSKNPCSFSFLKQANQFKPLSRYE